MKGPSETAINQAISILLQSIEEENAPRQGELVDPQTKVSRGIGVLQMASEAIGKALEAECSKWRRRLNGYAAVHSLPLEIFVKILAEDIRQHAPKPPSHGADRRAPILRQHELAQVCSYWRDTVLTEPSCWTEVRHEDGHVELILRKSKSALLHVTGGSTYPNLTAYLKFLRVVGPHTQRWKSASLSAPDNTAAQTIVSLLRSSPLPSLADLTLHFAGGHLFSLSLFNANFPFILDIPPIPNLRHIDFSHIAPPWNSWRLRRLRTLILETVRHGPTVTDLHDVLLASPELETLSLRYVTCGQTRRIEELQVRPVVLPRLSTLVLGYVDAEMLDYALCNVQPTALRVLHLHELDVKHLHSGSATIIAPALNRHAEVTLVNDCMEHFVLVDADDSDVREHKDAPLQLYWKDGKAAIEPLAKWLASYIGPQTRVNIDVNGRWLELSLGDREARHFPISVLEILSPHIRSIDVKHYGDAVDILECLSQPRSDDNGRQYWLCPNLTHLSLDQTRGLSEEDVEDFKMDRWGEEGFDDMEGRPVPLETFVPPDYSDSDSEHTTSGSSE